jgi:predicted nuclease of predicted toxin-antitoxin system
MNFLVDAQLPPGPCRWRETRGHQAVHVTEREGALADEAIAMWAGQDGLILISKDEDLLAIRTPDRFAFLWLRCGNATNPALAEWLGARWARVEELLAAGERVIELV